jgi:DNA-binding NarL/FixJ family response regulator
MLSSVGGWMVTLLFDVESISGLDVQIDDEEPDYDILIVNLSGFTESPKSIVKQISAILSAIPLLVLYSYSRDVLIKPLISAGANGYLQVGSSEVKLFEAVKKVAEGEEVILTEIT